MRMNNRKLYGQVGELHRRCREERGITRHDLAAQMGVTPYWLSLVESAERPMTVEYLLRVCPVLGMDLRMLKAS